MHDRLPWLGKNGNRDSLYSCATASPADAARVRNIYYPMPRCQAVVEPLLVTPTLLVTTVTGMPPAYADAGASCGAFLFPSGTSAQLGDAVALCQPKSSTCACGCVEREAHLTHLRSAQSVLCRRAIQQGV